jgi:hypothetical protein
MTVWVTPFIPILVSLGPFTMLLDIVTSRLTGDVSQAHGHRLYMTPCHEVGVCVYRLYMQARLR